MVLTGPASGEVQGVVSVTADAGGDAKVAGVQFILDGNSLGAEVSQPPYAVPWDTDESDIGAHTLSATARDENGRSALADPVSVTIELGSEIAFQARADGNSEIFIINADGTGRRRLTHNAGVDERPHWIMDGERIAFHATGREADGADGLYTMKPDGTDVRLLLKAPPGSDHRLSPDGQHIAFATSRAVSGLWDTVGELDVMNTDGSGVTELVVFGALCSIGCTKVDQPAWSPDGTQLAFGTSMHGHGGNTGLNLHVVNSDGTGLHLVTADGTDAAWSPDGKFIAYSAGESSIIPHPINLAILEVGLVTSESSPDVPNLWPSWSPDGKRLVFNRGEDISIINVDGSGLHPVTTGAIPAWNPAGAKQ